MVELTFSFKVLELSWNKYMWSAKGMYSTMTIMSATAIPVRRRLMGLVLMSLWVNTRMFIMLKIVPIMQIVTARYP